MPKKYDNTRSLEQAIEVAKEYGKGGSTVPAEILIEKVYLKLNKFKDEIEKTEE